MVVGHLKLYNTRTRSLEPFAPLHGKAVRIYVCGLTPSAQAHLGHARSFLFFDLCAGISCTRARRHLRAERHRHRRPQHQPRARDRRRLARDRRGYYAEFKDSMRKLGVMEPDRRAVRDRLHPADSDDDPRADRKRQRLCGRGRNLLRRARVFRAYGELSNRKIDELEAGARIEIGEHKEDPLDFALWKFAKPGEPKWPFEPYGDGRPGWHIECSAMSRELLDPAGAGFDIHGGGADLIFPHHENEIAQSEPLMPHPPMANFWVHGGLLNFEGRKMSKSLGNFEPLADSARAPRSASDPSGVSHDGLQQGDELHRRVARVVVYHISNASRKMYRALVALPASSARRSGLLERIEAALDEDMNTVGCARALLQWHPQPGSLAEFERALWLLGIEPNEVVAARSRSARCPVGSARAFARGVGAELSFNGDERGRSDRPGDRRCARSARASKDWAASDRIARCARPCGIALKDSKDGTTWTVAE